MKKGHLPGRVRGGVPPTAGRGNGEVYAAALPDESFRIPRVHEL